MGHDKLDLLLHPVRLRVIQALGTEELTTREIAARLPDVPTSSLYRHLRLLHEADLLAVVEVIPVRGVEEKRYALTSRTHLGPQEVRDLTADEHIRYFARFALALQTEFAAYIRAATADGQRPDLLADRVGYSELYVFATAEEWDRFAMAVNGALRDLLQNDPEPGRRKRKIATISHPLVDVFANPNDSGEDDV